MPAFYPPTALTTLTGANTQQLTYQPLLLVDIAFVDGVTFLHAATVAVTYQSIVYQPLVTKNTLDTVQKLTPIGIDSFPTATIQLADPSATIFGTYELLTTAAGFKGATVTLTLMMMDFITGAVSSDSYVQFVGRADAPSISETSLSFNLRSKLDLTHTMVPNVPISKLCPYPFPGTADEQAQGTDPLSIFYPCGYPGGSFTTCNYDQPSCIARGMFSLGRYGAVDWEPPATWSNPHIYTSGQKGSGWNTDNQAKYQSYVPLNYGPGLIKGVVANVLGDGNTVRFEVIVGWGDMEATGIDGSPALGNGGISMFIVNNVVVPHAGNDVFYSDGGYYDPTFCWRYVNNGARNGTPNNDAQYNGQGDPYGSMMVVEGVVPTTVHGNSNSAPDVLIVTTSGKKVRVYDSNVIIRSAANVSGVLVCTTFTTTGMGNDSWEVTGITGAGFTTGTYTITVLSGTTFSLGGITASGTYTVFAASASHISLPSPQYTVSRPICTIMDLLVTSSAFTYDDFDLGSAIDAEGVCQTTIPFTGVAGPYCDSDVQVASNGVTLTISNTNGGVFETINNGVYTQYSSIYVGQLVQVIPPQWDSSTAFVTGQFISYGEFLYEALANNTNEEPDVSPSYWSVSPAEDGINCRIQSIDSATQVTLVSPGVNKSITGGTLLVSHERYRLNLVIQTRQALSDLLNSIKLGCNLNLIQNKQTNKLQFFIDQGLGDQQPNPIPGSNDNSAYPSYLCTDPSSGDGTGGAVNYGYDGKIGTGYVAFNFNDDNTILLGQAPNYTSSLNILQQPSTQTPNRIITPFQNEEIQCESDTSTRVDTDDYNRMQQTFDATVQMEGVPNFDQLFRRANNYMARLYRGNPRSQPTYGDTGGTIIVELKVPGMQVGHLRVGHIVSVNSTRLGWGVSVPGNISYVPGPLFRIQSMKVDTNNFDIMSVTMGWHDDRWFLDSFGNGPAPQFSSSAQSLTGGTPNGWIAYAGAQPLAGDVVYTSQENWQPALELDYTTLADGSIQAVTQITGRLPVNNPSSTTTTPFISLQGNVDVSSGTVTASHYYLSVVALSSDGSDTTFVTFPQKASQLCQIQLASTGSLIIPQILWGSGALRGAVFVGTNPQYKQFQGYINPTVVSVVNTSGSTVTWVSGSTFSTLGTGDEIFFSNFVIGGVTYNGVMVVVDTVVSSTILTTTTSLATNSSVGMTALLPSSFTISGLTGASNPSIDSFPEPDPRFDHVLVQVKLVEHAGPVGAAISAVGTNTLTIANAGFGINQWTGYSIAVIGVPNSISPTPLFNALVVSNSAQTLTLNLDPSVNGVIPGCVLTIYSNSTVSLNPGGTVTFTDPNWVNSLGPVSGQLTVSSAILGVPSTFTTITTTDPQTFSVGNAVLFRFPDGTVYSDTVQASPPVSDPIHQFQVGYNIPLAHAFASNPTAYVFLSTGLAVGAEVGNLMRFINPDGTSFTARIGANDGTSVTTDGPMATVPANGAIFVIEEPNWHHLGTSTQSISTADPVQLSDISAVISNYENETILVQTLMVNSDGTTSAFNQSPFRMVWVFGIRSDAIVNAVVTATINGVPLDY